MADRNWHPIFDSDPPRRRFALDSAATVERGTCVTVASQKGGVGKTTTVVNLGAGAGLAGCKVLVIDFDPQANATSGVGEEKVTLGRGRRGGGGILDLVEDVERFSGAVRETVFENLWLFPSFRELSDLETIHRLNSTQFDYWKSTLHELKRRFDLILIDCPPSLGGIPNLALSVSEVVIIPVQCEFYAMEGLSQILPVVDELRASRNEALRVGGLLLTMFDHEVDLSREVLGEIHAYFPDLVFDSVIPRDVTLAEAASHGLPVLYYDFRSRGSWSYLELVREVFGDETAKTR